MGVYNDLSDKLKALMGDFYGPAMVALKIAAIAVLSVVMIKVGSFIIRRFFDKQKAFRKGLNEKKSNTMASLATSIFRYAVYIVDAIIVLSDIFDLTSVLAAAGVGGIAIGLGAQSFIKDVISGFFIVLEDQYAVGDQVTLGNMNGSVEELELRVTKLRSSSGDLYIIPNGEIKVVINHTRGDRAVIVDVPLAYSADTGRAVEIAEEVCRQASEEFDKIVEQPKVLGITELGRDGLILRIWGRTQPNAQAEVERRIRMLIKEKFDKEGIEFFDRDKIIMGSTLSKEDDRRA